MIVLYPLLVSNTISKNIIPGIAKVLENYLIVYRMNNIIKQANKNLGIKIQKVGKKLIQKESKEPLVDSLTAQFLREQSGIGSQTGPGNKNQDEGIKNARIDISHYNMQSITLEPTWIKVDLPTPEGMKYTSLIGVKVVPYSIKSEQSFVKLITYDRNVKRIMGGIIRLGRTIENAFYFAWKATVNVATLGLFGRISPAVTGDPRLDILKKRNILALNEESDIFAVANQADLADDFAASAKGMLNLQKMGWGSLIIADDVNKRVSFCMRELKGICSMMPYNMLYQTLSQARTFDDLEDAKRSAGSIFKVRRKSFSKIISESVSENKIFDYGRENLSIVENDLLNEIYLLDENLGSFVKKLTVKKFKNLLPQIIQGKKVLPEVGDDKLARIARKVNPDFKKSYELSKKVLKNTNPEVSDQMISLVSIWIAILAVLRKGTDVIVSTKEALKKFTKFYRDVKLKIKPKNSVGHGSEKAFGIAAVTVMAAMFTFVFRLAYRASQLVARLQNSISNSVSEVTIDVAPIVKSATKTGAEFGSWLKDIGESFSKGMSILDKVLPDFLWAIILLVVIWKILILIGSFRGGK